jgi:hypothetical protein
MPDRIFFSLAGLTALVLIALAFVWPQGLGRRSPKPFGYETASQIAARTPKLRPAVATSPALLSPVLSPALAPEPSSIPTPMAMPTPVRPQALPAPATATGNIAQP